MAVSHESNRQNSTSDNENIKMTTLSKKTILEKLIGQLEILPESYPACRDASSMQLFAFLYF